MGGDDYTLHLHRIRMWLWQSIPHETHSSTTWRPRRHTSDQQSACTCTNLVYHFCHVGFSKYVPVFVSDSSAFLKVSYGTILRPWFIKDFGFGTNWKPMTSKGLAIGLKSVALRTFCLYLVHGFMWSWFSNSMFVDAFDLFYLFITKPSLYYTSEHRCIISFNAQSTTTVTSGWRYQW